MATWIVIHVVIGFILGIVIPNYTTIGGEETSLVFNVVCGLLTVIFWPLWLAFVITLIPLALVVYLDGRR